MGGFSAAKSDQEMRLTNSNTDLAAEQISLYLLTGMHHSTSEARLKMAQFIQAATDSVETHGLVSLPGFGKFPGSKKGSSPDLQL